MKYLILTFIVAICLNWISAFDVGESCPVGCILNYNPLCAAPLNNLSARQTFNNQCLLDATNCALSDPWDRFVVIKHSACGIGHIPLGYCDPSSVCTLLDNNPVCAQADLTVPRTFSNQCELNVTNCNRALLNLPLFIKKDPSLCGL